MSKSLPKGWKIEKIGNLCEVGRGSSPRPIVDSKYFEGGTIPWIKIADATKSGKYLYETKEKVNKYGASFSRLLPKGSLIVAASGTLGYTQILGVDGCIHDGWLYLSNFQRVNKDFLYYLLQWRKDYFYNSAYGAAIQNVNTIILREMEIMLPPLHTQLKIASILSAYDDLIENNTRRIKILEEMAQAIYKEWFVNFRFPGHEKVKMVESDLGLIPEGWEVRRLGEVAELAYGKGLRKKDRREGTFPVYGSGGIVGYHDEYLVEGPGVIVGRKGNVGSVFWSQKSFHPIDTVFFVNSSISLYYIFFSLKEQNFVNNDAAVPGLSRNQAYLNKFLLPSNKILHRFSHIIAPIFNQIENLQSQIGNRRRTRDLLLLKLISGEINMEDLDMEDVLNEGAV